MKSYDVTAIEKRWQDRWAERRVHEAEVDPKRPKYYCLEMLPYPSGRIHMGHVRNYAIGDVMARFQRMRGRNVLHPIGWDSFGLPAENAAIDHGVQPLAWTEENIARMRAQFRRLGFSYAWEREIAAHRPDYYRWNQWLFLHMLERDLIYRARRAVNWCDTCQTVLANEQAEGGICWRCGAPVRMRSLPPGMALSDLRIEAAPRPGGMRLEFDPDGSLAFDFQMSLGVARYAVAASPLGEVRTYSSPHASP